MHTAEMVHGAQGRTRIRVPRLKRQVSEMARLATRVREHPGVTGVQTSCTTGCLVVYHRCPVEDLLHYAKLEGLFEVHPFGYASRSRSTAEAV
jgi:hypothetical protein